MARVLHLWTDMKPFTEWTVLPHGPFTRLGPDLFTVTGKMHMPPMGEVERRMTVVRLADGRLVIWSAIALAEPQMAELEALGTPAFLVVPSALHRMDIGPWKARYPGLTVITTPAAREDVEKVVPVDATSVDFGDPSVQFLPVQGTLESALVVRSGAGTTLVMNDVIFNLANRPGLRGWLFKLIGMTGDEPHIPPPVKHKQVKDDDALRAQLEAWSRLPNLERVIVAHGPIIDHAPAEMLARVANDLAS
jgi:hypothetical protein